MLGEKGVQGIEKFTVMVIPFFLFKPSKTGKIMKDIKEKILETKLLINIQRKGN